MLFHHHWPLGAEHGLRGDRECASLGIEQVCYAAGTREAHGAAGTEKGSDQSRRDPALPNCEDRRKESEADSKCADPEQQAAAVDQLEHVR